MSFIFIEGGSYKTSIEHTDIYTTPRTLRDDIMCSS